MAPEARLDQLVAGRTARTNAERMALQREVLSQIARECFAGDTRRAVVALAVRFAAWVPGIRYQREVGR